MSDSDDDMTLESVLKKRRVASSNAQKENGRISDVSHQDGKLIRKDSQTNGVKKEIGQNYVKTEVLKHRTSEEKKRKPASNKDDSDDDVPLAQLSRQKKVVVRNASASPAKEKIVLRRSSSLRAESEDRKKVEKPPASVVTDADEDDDVPLSALRQRKAVAKGSPKSPKAEIRRISPSKVGASPRTQMKVVRSGTTAMLVSPEKSRGGSGTITVKKTIAKKPANVIKQIKRPQVVKKSASRSAGTKKSQARSVAPSNVSIRKDEYVFVGGEEGDENRWWQDNDGGDSEEKWKSLIHQGVVFPPPYEPVQVPLIYDGEEIILPPAVEEIGMFYAAKLETEYVAKKVFNDNFFRDFRIALRKQDPALFKKIKSFNKCDFTRMHQHLEEKKAQNKALTSAERKAKKQAEAEKMKKYTIAMVDGREEKVGNFRVEPPALFLGRGEHPLTGKVKKRIMPEDITINIGKKDPVPECPIEGHKWGKVIHNRTVTWLAFWRDTITNGAKYVFLAADSKFKTISDAAKFEKARNLHQFIEKIRTHYRRGWNSKDKLVQQRSVAMYLIDVLALRVGNEKGEDEADTVGCCSLRVEHITLNEPDTIEFDFLGKDSIRYLNSVKVDKGVFRSLKKLVHKKKPTDDVFDKLTTSSLNEYLKTLMEGLTAKVFRTYNASLTLDRLLREGDQGTTLNDKLVFYNQQNKEVAILCNHQRSLPKAHEAQMEKLQGKNEENLEWLRELERGIDEIEKSRKQSVDVTQWVRKKPEIKPDMTDEQKSAARKEAAEAPREKVVKSMKLESLEKTAERVREQIDKARANMQTKEDLKTVALGTSKINYLDPRISVAWCKKQEVPLERIFPKTLTVKFAWAMEASEDFTF